MIDECTHRSNPTEQLQRSAPAFQLQRREMFGVFGGSAAFVALVACLVGLHHGSDMLQLLYTDA